MSAIAPAPKKSKVDARAAANTAAAYFKELYPNVKAVSLEKVELSDDGSHWLITLSFEIGPFHGLAMLPTPFQTPRTNFKVFKVDANTARVIVMKIRQLE